MNIKDAIITESKRIGIDIIGFTDCKPFYEAEQVLIQREKMNFLSGFEDKDIKKRIDPKKTMEDCKTIISIGVSYNTPSDKVPIKKDYIHKGVVSRSSWGEDYHAVLSRKLKKLSLFIEQSLNGKTKFFVDTGSLIDREIARRAGIGYVGKNCSIINKEYGSYIFLGEILTDLHISPDKTVDSLCGDCELCIKSCHANALEKPYTLNAKKCISYLTQCKDLPNEYYKKMGNSIYGCDACQRVCPKNKTALKSNHTEFYPMEWNAYPDLVDVLNMDNRRFKDTFNKTSGGWRGKKNLQRNSIIAMGNSKNKNIAKYIEAMLYDDRIDIRKTSIYALYNLLGKESIPMLKRRLEYERDDGIISIINKLVY